MEVRFGMIWVALILLATSPFLSSSSAYEMDDNSAHDVRWSANEQFSAAAINNFRQYLLSFYSYGKRLWVDIQYSFENVYVYSLVILANNENTSSSHSYRFIQVGENMTNHNVYLIHTTFQRFENGAYKTLIQKRHDHHSASDYLSVRFRSFHKSRGGSGSESGSGTGVGTRV